MAFSSIEFDVRKKRINRASSVITLLCQARGFAFETWQNRKGWIQGEGASLASFESWGLSLLKKVFVYICGLKKKRSVKKKPRGGGGCKKFAHREVDVYCLSYVDAFKQFYLPHQCYKLIQHRILWSTTNLILVDVMIEKVTFRHCVPKFGKVCG